VVHLVTVYAERLVYFIWIKLPHGGRVADKGKVVFTTETPDARAFFDRVLKKVPRGASGMCRKRIAVQEQRAEDLQALWQRHFHVGASAIQ
jgi:hypothetical protein